MTVSINDTNLEVLRQIADGEFLSAREIGQYLRALARAVLELHSNAAAKGKAEDGLAHLVAIRAREAARDLLYAPDVNVITKSLHTGDYKFELSVFRTEVLDKIHG